MRSDYNNGWATGEDNNRSMMSNAEVRAARELRCTMGMTVRELTLMYSPISQGAMSLLLRGLTYKDAGGPIAEPDPRGNRKRRANLEA